MGGFHERRAPWQLPQSAGGELFGGAIVESLLAEIRDGVAILDANMRPRAQNAAFARMYGAHGPGGIASFVEALEQGQAGEAFWADLSKQGRFEGEYWQAPAAESPRRSERAGDRLTEHSPDARCRNVRLRRAGPYFLAVVTDVTERRRQEARLKETREEDPVSGVFNRAAFMTRARRVLAAGGPAAVIVIDIDDFSGINAAGHAVGDAVLRSVAMRLAAGVRASDLVGRVGADEFAVLCAGADRETAASAAEWMVAAVAVVAADENAVSGRAGVAVSPDHGEIIDDLVNAAAGAAGAARSTDARIRFHEATEGAGAKARAALRRALARPEARDGFDLHFQPKIDLGTETVAGVEALLRWQSPAMGGPVSPVQFIPVLEETGEIVPIGLWIARTAIRRHLEWREAGFVVPAAINLSARQIFGDGFLDSFRLTVEEELAARASPLRGPDVLTLEVTESMAMADMDRAIAVLGSLAEEGYSIAMDDFGTGHSSLGNIRAMPVSTIKIDRSFVIDIEKNASAAALARAVIGMAEALERKTVAEGVENAAQRDLLKDWGCSQIQGYFYSRPLPSPALLDWLRQRSAEPHARDMSKT